MTERTLATCVEVGPPHEDSIEETHAHVKDLARSSRHSVTSEVQKARAAIHSDVIESRGILHKRVTKESFRRRFNNKPRPIAWRFNPSHHKISPQWSSILRRRTWASPTPETARMSIAGWRWARLWDSMPADVRPAIADGQLTSLLGTGKVLGCTEDATPMLTLANAKWAGFALTLVSVGAGVYRVSGLVRWIHCWDPEPWRAYTVEWWDPQRVASHNIFLQVLVCFSFWVVFTLGSSLHESGLSF